MIYLNAEQILFIHSAVIDETGGSHGVRDHASLAALEGLPRQKAFGKELYPSVFHKAAVYIRNVIGSHPFIDGNKRTAMSATAVFLELNGYAIQVKEGAIEEFAIRVIREKLTIEDIAGWLKKNTQKSVRK